MKGIPVRVSEIRQETSVTRRIELRPAAGDLPPFTAGAHIDVQLPNGMMRSYSLLNSQEDRDRYVVGVYLEPTSRGASRYFHENISVGDELLISSPRNLFSLDEGAAPSVLIGGGIGVTPLLSMADRLSSLRRKWRLYYCCRSRPLAAFRDDLQAYGDQVTIRYDDESDGFLNIEAQMRAMPDAHFYCCGPKPMLTAFQDAARAAALPSAQIHLEDFKPTADLQPQGGFTIELARSGRILEVPSGKTILQVLQEAGITATSSCEVGICGECQTAVLEGIPDHKDSVLSDAERASNKAIMICCSGSKSEKLVLDI
ncbi:PDR/VanB family oxidoreductase [Bradyrhizobium sp. WSM2254]|uniref:PDR/VanB family oxidoreductase n=1 Tax=Bradyrhizobium sp. WSM2254 TaxID=1188263 RepID=UPI0004152D17|nr:PDR/VanB family oxidoreductase [Bradyrhizobium sp. WSM2254]